MNRFSYSVVSLLAFGVGLEVTARLDEWVRWRMPFDATASSVNDIITVDGDGARGIPHAQYRQFTLNSLGLRGPEPHDGLPRLLVLGASESFGLYESPGREYPRQLEDSLTAAGCRVDVINAALPGFSLPTLLASFRHSIGPLNASAALIYPTPVQYLELKRPVFTPPLTRGGGATPFAPRIVRRMRDHVKAVLPDWIKTALRQREIDAQRAELAGATVWNAVPDDRLDAFMADLSAMLDTLAARGVTPIIATHANAFPPNRGRDPATLVGWAKFYPRASAELLPQFDSVANQGIRTLAEDRAVALSDAAAVFGQRSPGTRFADFSHFTDVGAAEMAGLVARDIIRQIGCPQGR